MCEKKNKIKRQIDMFGFREETIMLRTFETKIIVGKPLQKNNGIWICFLKSHIGEVVATYSAPESLKQHNFSIIRVSIRSFLLYMLFSRTDY